MAKKFGKFLFVTAAVAAAAGAYYYYFQEKERLNKFMEDEDVDFDDFHYEFDETDADVTDDVVEPQADVQSDKETVEEFFDDEDEEGTDE